MGIIANESDSFPGALAIAEPPYGYTDCCAYGTLSELYDAMQAAGHACVFRGGKLYVEQTVAQIVSACAVANPTVTSVSPDPIIQGLPWSVMGTGFQATGGKVYLADNSSWAAATLKIEQSVESWATGQVNLYAPVLDGLPMSPSHVYVFVETRCEQRNAVGFETEITTPP